LFLFLFLLPGGRAQIRPQPLIPYEKVYFGDELVVKVRLIDSFGNPVLGADVKAYTDFLPPLHLHDDGRHQDDVSGDGIYANTLLANGSVGTHIITISYAKGDYSESFQYAIQILPRPGYGLLFYAIPFLVFGSFLAFFLRRSMRARRRVRAKLTELENKRSAIEEFMRKTEQAYFTRKIDEATFRKRMDNYRAELDKIEVEIEALKARKARARSKRHI
jgi:hypothetical protein